MSEGLKMENSNEQKFCLKWNNFQRNFMSQFEALKENEDFVDVTFYSSGQCIKAHKVVLSACSPYLKNIFKENPCKHPIIILDNLSFNNLEAVIQFVYTGEVYVEQGELSSFLKAAETLQIRGLSGSSSCQNLIETSLPPVHETDNAIICTKKDVDIQHENKKLKSRKTMRYSNDGTEENSEFHEELKNKENDWCLRNDKPEGSSENMSINVMNGEQTFEVDEKILSTSSGDEDYTPGELKRRRWLDPRSCRLCNRVYSNLSNLRQHIKLIHNPTLATCRLCYKTFKTDLYLRRHLISFHELNGNGITNNMSMESCKPIQNQILEWNSNVKLEPDAFDEMFQSNDFYQVPQ